MNERNYVILEHTAEVKHRLLYTLASFSSCLLLAYLHKQETLYLLTQPLNNQSKGHMIYTSMLEGFIVSLKLSAMFSLMVVLPYIMYQIWSFVSSGLYKEEKHFVGHVLVMTLALTILACLASYRVIIPHAWTFFSSFQLHGDPISLYLEARLEDYLHLTSQFMLIFIIIFQVPLSMFMFLRFKIISLVQLTRHRRYIYLSMLIISTLVSPPDIASQVILWAILSALFELSLVLGFILDIKWKRSESNR